MQGRRSTVDFSHHLDTLQLFEGLALNKKKINIKPIVGAPRSYSLQ